MPATYAENLAELESILNSMRSEACDIDTLAERTRRAAALLNVIVNRSAVREHKFKA